MTELRVKGHGLHGMLAALSTIEGSAVRARVEARIPRDFADALKHGAIVAGGFYPLAWARAIHQLAMEEGTKGAKLPYLLGHENTSKNLHGIYAFVVKMFDPGTVISQGKRLMTMYYGGGTADVIERTPHSALMRYRECVGFDRPMFEELAGGSVAIVEACGGQDASADIRSITSTSMEVLFRWA